MYEVPFISVPSLQHADILSTARVGFLRPQVVDPTVKTINEQSRCSRRWRSYNEDPCVVWGEIKLEKRVDTEDWQYHLNYTKCRISGDSAEKATAPRGGNHTRSRRMQMAGGVSVAIQNVIS